MKLLGFGKEQWREIFLGIKHKVNFFVYLNRVLSAEQMKEFREGLEQKLDVSWYWYTIHYERKKIYYSVVEMKTIKEALILDLDKIFFEYGHYNRAVCLKPIIEAAKNNIPVNRLAKKGFGYQQIVEISNWLIKGIDFVDYINSNFDVNAIRDIGTAIEMGIDVLYYCSYHDDYLIKHLALPKEIKKAIQWQKEGFDVNKYIREGYRFKQIEEIFLGCQLGLDTTKYVDIEFDDAQMRQIRLGLETDINISAYAKKEYTALQMEAIREGIEAGVDISKFANPNISADRMKYILRRQVKIKKSNNS